MIVKIRVSTCSWQIALACLFVSLLFPIQDQAQPLQKLHKHVPPAVASGQAALVGSLPVTQAMQLTIVLPLRNEAALTSLLSELYDPSSPNYRHFLSVQQFTDQFSPTEQDYQSVIQWANDHGFIIAGRSENRLTLDVSGTTGQVNSALHVSMNVYQDPNGKRTFYSIDREPTLNLSVPVKHIEGLNNFSVPQPLVKRKKNAGPVADVTGSGPGGYYLGSDMRAAYYGGSLLTGAGQCVGLLEFGGYRLSDVNLTFNNAGQSYSVPINNVLIDGATAAAGSDDSEEVLDIVQAIGMAPGLTQVRVYIGTGGHDADVFNSMAGEDVCKQLSVSWSWAPADPGSDDGIFQELAAQGQSIFVASGDDGAYDAALSPYFYPAEDDYVTAVGGTHLTTNYGSGPWVSETAWNNSPYGSGGGISPDGIPIPSWQQGVASYPNGGSTALRNVPDVDMEADLDNFSCDMGTCAGGIGGTSFAAPRWAGFMALINQQATEAGTAPSGGLGFINPSIYAIGEGSNYGTDLHDITSGNNDTANQLVWYSAVTGYDLVTGWGSPNGQNFIDAVAGPLIPGFWLSPAPASFSVSQSSSITATITVIDAGGFAGNVGLTASGLPSGVTASFDPSPTTGTSVLTLTASSTASLGTATVTITGTSGSLVSTTPLFLTVDSPSTSSPPTGGFGSMNVGTASQPSALTVTFTTAGTLGNIAVLTQGVPNLEFTNASGGTCAIGTAYAANATCIVNVTFTPRYAGMRYGAVVLVDATGNQLAKLYLQGTGVGPQTTFAPGTQTTVGSGFISPEGAAILGDGSFYVTDFGSTSSGALYLEKLSNGTYTQSTINCSFKTPVGVAVDGSGTIYVADPGVPAVYKVIISNGNCSEMAIGSGFGKPWGVAVDGIGDVFITDLGTSSIPAAVYKEQLQANGAYVQSTVGNGWLTPTAVAVDGSGNIDVADYAIPGVFVETPSGGSYTQSAIGAGWTAPSGIAVDGNGNIYISDTGNGLQYGGGSVPAAVFKEVVSSGTYVQTKIGSGWILPYGVAVDASGNVYVADQTRGASKNDLADPPPIGFANAVSATTSSDSPKTVTVSNIGTAALQFSSVAYPADFPEAAGVPTDCTSNTSLAAGGSCTLSMEFLPTTALGTNTSLALNESVTITTNTLNINPTQQGVPVSGTEVLPGGSVALSVSSDPAAAGTPVTFTATVAGSTGGPTPTGTVTFYNGTTSLTGPLTLSNGVATYSTASLAVGTYPISASYSGGASYLASNSNSVTENIIAAPGTSGFGDTTIGTQNVGTTSAVIPLAITFNTAETLGNIAVLTGGVPNLDYVNAGRGTCSIGTAYVANASCTVNLTFTPKESGTRYGAVVLSDNNGNVIGTGYLEGTGIGPQTVFLSGTLSLLVSGYGFPQGVAVDGDANLYVADAADQFGNTAAVYKGTTALGSGFSQPHGVAIDAAGNIYVTDVGNHAVYKEAPSNGSYIQTVIGYGFIWPSGVAMDALGNVYVADFGNGVTPGAVYLETLSNGSYTQSTIGSSFVTPQSIAVDGSGNIYVADSANGNGVGMLYKLALSNGTYNQTTIGTGWVTPTGVAVDGNGNIYVTDDVYDLGKGFVAKETLQPDGSYVQSTVLTSASMPYPGGVAVDGRGNLYITPTNEIYSENGNYYDSGLLYNVDLADPPAVTFAATMFGSTSSDSPHTVTVQNSGNANLTFSGVSYPADFPEATGSTTDCTSQLSLAPGNTCTLTANFKPSAPLEGGQPAPLSENVTITTNALGSSTQNITVSGTEASPTDTVALSTQANIYTVGTTVTFTATVTGQSGFAGPTGTVTFNSTTAGNTTPLSTLPLGANGTATYSTSSLTAGSYSITASYSGDQVYAGATSPVVMENIISASGFGIESIGSSTSSTSETITFPSRVTLGSIAVLTEGISNLDFTNTGSGTCKVGTAYKAKSSCTVNISFQPRLSGARHGALVIGDNSGHLLQTIYLHGTGVGPQLTFQPASATTVVTEQSAPCAQAVDSYGDIYIVSSNGVTCGPITKFVPSNGSYTQSLVPSSTLSNQVTIAVDGAGDVYIADTGNGRVLKETLFGGAYSESSLATGLNMPREVVVDGNGVVYFIVGVYNGTNYLNLYSEAPSSSGTYVQTIGYLPYGQNVTDPTEMAIDGQGNIFVKDHHSYCCYYTQDAIWYPNGSGLVMSGQQNQIVTMDFMDANGNLYITVGQSLMELTQNGSNGFWTQTKVAVPTNVWGMDGSGNFYGLVGSAVTIVKSAAPTSLRFAETNVGSTSSDSPEKVTVQNIGNAPLTFSVPSTGTNPSISSNFSLDPSTSCPQISVSGTASSLPINNSCTYAVNFTPTESGALNGSLVLADNALNAVGGTQTIPLIGAGVIGAGGTQAQIAILAVGPGGSEHVSWVPLGSKAVNAAANGIWVDKYNPTFIVGVGLFGEDQYGNVICTDGDDPGSLSELNDLLGGKFSFGYAEFTLPNNQCPGQLYKFSVAYDEWGSDQADLQDPFTLKFTFSNSQYNGTVSSNAEFAHIALTSATQSSSTSPITATASLINSPAGATGYTWTISGGGGAIVFLNGQETMSSTTNSITVEEPHPNGSSVPFSLSVVVATTGSPALEYGPTQVTIPGQIPTADPVQWDTLNQAKTDCPPGQAGWTRNVVKQVVDINGSGIQVAGQQMTESYTIQNNGLTITQTNTGQGSTNNVGMIADSYSVCSTQCPGTATTSATQHVTDTWNGTQYTLKTDAIVYACSYISVNGSTSKAQ